ncbi:MAG TPA: hypothetical protein VND70_06630 [Acidimicrobiales bacterium]|nr:hypothetical protein [Acidimicrobiales bacterium]
MAKNDKSNRPVKTKGPPAEHWKEEPEEHDFPAAAAYLSLINTASDVKTLVVSLRASPLERRMAKDILRASRLELLTPENPHVAADLAKVKRGDALSPVLLVRGDLRHDIPLTVADGYHRVCASFHLDENAAIPCRLADLVHVRSSGSTRTRSSRGPTAVQ